MNTDKTIKSLILSSDNASRQIEFYLEVDKCIATLNSGINSSMHIP